MEKVRRITALITVIIIVALVIGTFICAVIGSPYFYGMLALTFFVPIILWVFMWFTRLTQGQSEVIPELSEVEAENEESETMGTEPGNPTPQ